MEIDEGVETRDLVCRTVCLSNAVQPRPLDRSLQIRYQ